jgi:hypothetical protein
MRLGRKRIKKILLCGRLPNQMNLGGILSGEMGDLAGILSAQLWHVVFLDRKSTFIQEESI